jgi:DNA-directed RNA polymerase subunit RPC12/RpoP
MKKTVLKCDRCGFEVEMETRNTRPVDWHALSIDKDLCVACSRAYESMQEMISKIREKFFNGKDHIEV